MKSENIKLGKYLNQELWKNGPKNPPSKVKINVTKEENLVKAELIGAPEEEIKEEPKKKGLKEKIQEKTSKTPKTKKEEKVPTAKELKETKKPAKKEKEVPKAADLKKEKTSKK